MQFFPALEATRFERRDFFAAVGIYVALLAIFWASPVQIVSDSRYTLLLTHNLLHHGGFSLDRYGLPRQLPVPYGAAKLDGDLYQLEYVDGHLHYFFPPGTSILVAPFVLAQEAFGRGVVGPDGTFNVQQEVRDQHFIAAALMAALGVVFYLTARLVLPVGWGTLVALGASLGTQVYSTASRALWNHAWGLLLIAATIYLLLSRETGRREKLPPVLLATLVSWSYFVRPTNSLFILGVTVYLLLFHRAGFVRYALTGAAWLGAFVAWSWFHYGQPLPTYYAAARLQAVTLKEALAGNLVSPSRGLLIFVPVALFVVYLPLRYWRYRRHARLLGLGVAVSACQYAAVSGFVPWYGGGCYGPRYTTEFVPWLALTAALGLAAALRWREDYRRAPDPRAWRRTLATGGALLAVSILINARGAIARSTRAWNEVPVPIDKAPARVWDWRYPQILAGILPLPLPHDFPLIHNRQRVFFGREGARPYQYEGWRDSDADGCWSSEKYSKLIFALDGAVPRWLRLEFGTYVHPPQVTQQHVIVLLNDQVIGDFVGKSLVPRQYVLTLPAGLLRRDHNVLSLDLPDATVPADLGVVNDTRRLGVSMRWLEFTDVEPMPEPEPEL